MKVLGFRTVLNGGKREKEHSSSAGEGGSKPEPT